MYVVLFKDNTEGSLLYHHLKLYLEPHGIKVMTAQNESANLGNLIQNYNVKALFLDEWLVTPNLSRISEQVEVMWIAPNALSILNAFTDDAEMKSKFKSLNLSFNMRNSHEVVRSSKKLAEKMLYRYETGLVKPPVLFPTGTTPLEIQTVGELFVNVVPNKKTGILMIADAKQKSAFDHLLAIINSKHTNKKIKVYSQWKNDFTGSLINPIQFLKDGNILVTTTNWASGFEWDTVVLITFMKKVKEPDSTVSFENSESILVRNRPMPNPEKVSSDFRIEGHPCNAMLRCTTHLIKFQIVLKPEFGAEQDRNKKLFNSDCPTLNYDEHYRSALPIEQERYENAKTRLSELKLKLKIKD
ncbi:uncharacterized protein [Clytia hemisphaerica]|uniref:Uncharacterized protein n=1 Tax=Clytia hemisphaerica TaxID=252671 RepID=A0A7M5VDG3_9CNID